MNFCRSAINPERPLIFKSWIIAGVHINFERPPIFFVVFRGDVLHGLLKNNLHGVFKNNRLIFIITNI